MRVLRERDYRRMPWKNGGGETVEMIASPHGASLDAFDWRISMAHVAVRGPFSLFPCIDRTLSVIAGASLSLVFDDRTVALDRSSDPFRFSGDAKVESTLSDGPIDDLNVMTRRGRYDHRVIRHAVSAPMALAWEGNFGVVIAIEGSVDLQVGAETVTLASHDAAVFDANNARGFIASPQGEADLIVVEIFDKLMR